MVPTIQHETTGEYLDVGLPSAAGEGGALAASLQAGSTWRDGVDDLAVATEEMTFAGMDGVYRQELGSRGRRIRLSGFLRVTTGALTTIRSQRDRLRRSGGTFAYASWDGSTFTGCALARFDIQDADRVHIEDAVLEWRIPYEIELRQLDP